MSNPRNQHIVTMLGHMDKALSRHDAEARINELEILIYDLVSDNSDRCDNRAECMCSIARAYRTLPLCDRVSIDEIEKELWG